MPEHRWLTSTQIVQMVSAAEAKRIREVEAARRAIPAVRTSRVESVPEWLVVWALVAVSVVGLALWACLAGG